VHGIGNSRGEVIRDPAGPANAAERLGRELFSGRYTDYRLDTARSGKIWPVEPAAPASGKELLPFGER